MIARDNPGVIAPPPLLFLGTLAAGLLIDFFALRLPLGLPAPVRFAFMPPVAAAGVALILAAMGKFKRAGTAVPPWEPTTAIVSTGVYGYSRNPIYVGMSLIYLAIAVGADSGVALALLVPLIVVVRHGVIGREERYLEAKFGEEYRGYMGRVRRWV